jgi:hypothetical protein
MRTLNDDMIETCNRLAQELWAAEIEVQSAIDDYNDAVEKESPALEAAIARFNGVVEERRTELQMAVEWYDDLVAEARALRDEAQVEDIELEYLDVDIIPDPFEPDLPGWVEMPEFVATADVKSMPDMIDNDDDDDTDDDEMDA